MSRFCALVALLGAVACWAAPKERPLYDDRFFAPTEEVVSPHIPWAKPYVTPPKVLFITHRGAMREAIEIAQRLSMDYEVFAMETPSMFGATGIGVDASWTLIRGNSNEELAERLRKSLATPHDVIVAGGVDWDKIPLDCRYEILKQVKTGTGLVGCIRKRDQYLPDILKGAEFGWNWATWSGAAQGIADYFGTGVYEGAVDYSGGHTGQAALRIECKSVTKGSREASRAGYYVAPVKLEPGTEYVFSMWTRTQGLQNGQASVSLHPVGGGVAVPASDTWKLTEHRFRTNAAATSMGVYLLNYQPGTVWYDDVKLVQAGTDENLLPNPSFEFPGPAPAELATGFAYKLLPAFGKYADATAFLRGTVQSASFGQGRIGLVSYAVPSQQMLTPGPSGPVQYCRDDYDYYLQLAVRLILWGAKKTPPAQVTTAGGEMTTATVGQTGKLALNVRAAQAVPGATVALALGGPGWPVCASQPLNLQAGDNAVALALPALPAGQHWANVRVQAGGKTLGFASLGVEVASPVTIKSLELTQPSFSLAEPIKGKLVVDGPVSGASVALSARDSNGRLLGTAKVAVAGAETEFSVPVIPSSTIIGWLTADLLQGGKAVASEQRDFSMNNLYAPRDDVQYVMWQGYGNSFLAPMIAESFSANGIDAFYDGGSVGYGPYANQWWLPYATRYVDTKTDWYQEKPTRQAGDLVRDPCLTNPEYRQKVTETLTKCAVRGLQYSTSDFTLGDENHFVAGRWDLCFSDTCVADFQRWARETYGSLDKLNAAWGSRFANWSDVKPQTLEEAQKTGNLVPWVDHRLHMESVWAGIHDFSREVIKQTVPHARVGYEGSDTVATSWQADDYWQLARAMSLNNIYYRDFLSLAVRDFSTPDTLLGAGWFGGYAGNRNEPFMRWFPWRTLFKGANSFWVWCGYGNAGSVMAWDTSLYPFFKAACEEVGEIKQGPGKLLMNAERQHDGIALLWSDSSVHLATATAGFPDIDTTLSSMVMMLHDCGLEAKVLSYAEVRQGKLTNDQFKVLLLPSAQALSAAEVAAIKQFAANGGTVIADLRPGVTDEHGKPYATPALDELFGVSQTAAFAKATGSLDFAGAPETSGAGLKADNVLVDGSLKAAAGKALAQVGSAPVLVAHASGKGKALLLNLSLQGYSKLPKVEGQEFAGWNEGAGYRAFLAGVLKTAGIEPVVRVLPDAPHVEVSRFRRGGAEYIGIVQSLPFDTLAYTNKTAPALQPRAVTVDFGRKAHLYDVRAGKYLGEVQNLRTKLTPGLAHLYALLPYRVEGLRVTAPAQATAGQALTCQVALQAKGRLGDHVVRMQVFGPDGKERPWYARNLMTQAAGAQGRLTLALDDAPGAWKIVARDVATGVTGSGTVKVAAK
ncbi:beta-galactosidase [bacterium]|nr:beta-galactosidase [bacterium]